MGKVRIIGGMLRGRMIAFPEATWLRPTPDRARETLFNWLAPQLVGSHCLDLFAGSGVLGFEALSRGAATVVMMDRHPQVIQQLQRTAVTLQVAADIFLGDFQKKCPHLTGPFDVVFLDPPYDENLLVPVCEKLMALNCLSPQAVLYVEAHAPLEDVLASIPCTFKKVSRAGKVHFGLIWLSSHAVGASNP